MSTADIRIQSPTHDGRRRKKRLHDTAVESVVKACHFWQALVATVELDTLYLIMSESSSMLGSLYSNASLQTQWIVGIALTVAAGIVVTVVLIALERHHCTLIDTAIPGTSPSTPDSAGAGDVPDDLELEIDDASSYCSGLPDSDDISLSSMRSGRSRHTVGEKRSPPKQQQQQKHSKPRLQRRPLRLSQHLWILAQVVVLVLLNYLLLVFLPNHAVVLCLAGAVAVWALVLHAAIAEEIRRRRADRLLTLLASFLWIASGLSLAVFARLSLAEGSIYQGKARIVGYNTAPYQNVDGETLRANLEVAWGGAWGCPNSMTNCQAVVEGALCETEYDPADYVDEFDDDFEEAMEDQEEFFEGTIVEDDFANDDNVDDEGSGRLRRRLAEQGTETVEEGAKDSTKAVENETETSQSEAEDGLEQSTRDSETGEDEQPAQDTEQGSDEQLAADSEQGDNQESAQEQPSNNLEETQSDEDEVKQVEKEEQKEEELEKENEQLEDENEELEQDLEDEEDANEELEWENEALAEYIVDYEDDYYEDSYWYSDWGSVWGDYACEDLFDSDLEGESYDPDVEPGNDEWPFVYIYGSCATCEAYLVDYYSTEHFNNIQAYHTRGVYYAAAAAIATVLASLAAIKQRLNPSNPEKQIELLSSDGGVLT